MNSTAALPPDELVREYWKLAQENNDLLRALERSARGSVTSLVVGVEARQYRLGCDVTRGQWQRYDRDHSPELDGCIVRQSSSACGRGKSQLYAHLWWVPKERGCEVPLPIGPEHWLRAHTHVKLALVGDSLLRSIFYSLPCMMGHKAPSLSESQQTATIMRSDINASFRVDMLWSPLLTAGQRTTLTTKIPGGWTTAVADSDLLVIGIGPHFAYEAGPRAQAMRKAGYAPLNRTSRKQFLRDSLHTTVKALHGFMGTIVVLGYPNDHRMLPDGNFSSSGTCDGDYHDESLQMQHVAAYQNAPLTASSLSHYQLSSFAIGEEVYQAFSEHFHTIHLNLHDMYASRFDAHLGNSSLKFDCMHWCTGSGVPEVILGILNKALYTSY